MSTGRYVGALIVGGIILIVGIILPCVYLKGSPDSIGLSIFLAYSLASLVTNLIWFSGPVITVAAFGFKLVGTIIVWLFSLLGSLLGWLLLIFFGPFILTAALAIACLTVFVICVVSCVMLPINIFVFARDLY